MALEGVYANYRKAADEVNWKDYNCNDLFFEYIKHENDDLAEKFFAGIVCRYWGYAGRIYVQCNKHVTFEECHDCIIDAIRYVLKNRVWENPKNSLYQDKTGPDKAIHIAMKRQKGILLSRLSAYRRKTNFNTLSIDSAHDNYSDSADGLLFDSEMMETNAKIDTFISTFFMKGDYISGLFLDIICYNSNESFDTKSVIKILNNLDSSCYDYFNDKYTISLNDYEKALNQIKLMSNKMLNMKLKALLYSLREVYVHD